jgi:hypothetical protein
MNTHSTVAPRIATIERDDVRREGRNVNHRPRLAAGAGALLALAMAACTPGASSVPLPSLVVPSVDASVAASALSGAALTALDQVDGAITATQTAGGLTADEASSLTQLSAGVRTALQTGDTAAAKTAVDNLSTKVDSFAAKLNTDAGKQLTAALAALKAALPAS